MARLGRRTPINRWGGQDATRKIIFAAGSGSTITATTSLAAAIQAAQAATATVAAAIQIQRTTSADITAAIQIARTAQATVDGAIQASATAAATLTTAIQAARTASASVSGAVQIGRTATSTMDGVIQVARSATAAADAAIRAALSATATLSAYIQAGSNVGASVNAAIQISRSGTASLDAAIQTARTATTTLAAAVRASASAMATLSAYIQAGTSASASVNAAIQAALAATASVDAAIAVARSASASLGAAIAVQLSISTAVSAAVQAAGAASVSLAAYVFDDTVANFSVPSRARIGSTPARSNRARVGDAMARSPSKRIGDLCNTLVGGLPSDGEFLLRVVVGADAGNKFGFALQLIDVDRIDTTFSVAAAGARNAVIMGVEVESYRRPVAYHIHQSHPSEGIHSNRQRVRVEAKNIIHRFRVTRAEQVRGIPWMAPGMLSLHHLGSFKLAALLNAENGANHFGFFESPEGAPPIGNVEADGRTVTVSQPGTYDTLPPGYKFSQHESKYPNEVFAPFVKTTLQRIASGWGVAYHSLANDLEGVSFSSIRSGTLEERDRWAADQAWFIAAVLEPVYQQWIQVALLKGAITLPNGSALPASKIGKFAKHEWQPRRWDWVDPKADTESRILTVRAGLVAPQDIAASMGYDFEDTMVKISDAQKLAKELGVKLTAYESTPGANGANGSVPSDPPAKPSHKSART